MPTSGAQKVPAKSAAPAPAEHSASAFGITIADNKHSSAQSPETDKKKKQMILGGVLLGVAVLVLAWQYWPSSPGEDPAVTATPQIKPVVQAEEKKDMPRLQEFARSNDPIVASRAVTALAGLGDTSMVDQAAKDNRPEVRLAAVSAMTAKSQASNVASLSRFMHSDPSPDVRLQALSGVASVPSLEAVDSLLPMLNDPDATIRNAAVRALENKTGFRFRDYNPARSDNGAAIARIRNLLTQSRNTLQAHFESQQNAKSQNPK